jgi:hypothetical protein
MASADYYLKIDTIEGESESVGFEKQMQIESWSFGASNSGSAGTGTGLGTGKVSMQDFHFVIQNGKASVQLFPGDLQRQPHSAGDFKLPQNRRRRNAVYLLQSHVRRSCHLRRSKPAAATAAARFRWIGFV